MRNFATKKIFLENEEIGSLFSSTRKAKKISLKQASLQSGINVKNLTILEKGDFSLLPEGVYRKRFIKEYADFLGIDSQELLQGLEDEQDNFFVQDQKNAFSRQTVKKWHFVFFPKILKVALIVLVVIASLIYLGSSFKKTFSPPELFLSSPSEDAVVNNPSIMVVGSTEPEAQIMINNEPVGINEFGDFSKEINLKNGINIIKISAKKKYSQEVVEERYILMEP